MVPVPVGLSSASQVAGIRGRGGGVALMPQIVCVSPRMLFHRCYFFVETDGTDEREKIRQKTTPTCHKV